MEKLQLGLEVAFYLYPVGLFATLFGAQALSYRYRNVSRAAAADEKQAEKIERFYARILWCLQLLLTPLLLTSIILVLHNAITGRGNTNGDAVFPNSAYLSSHIGVLLYFLAGLLPDPDGPWSPSVSHGYAWLVGLMVDVVINSVLLSEHELIPLPKSLVDSLFSLGIGRVAVYGLMLILLARRQHLLRPERGSAAEGRSLLENGDGPANGYGGANGHGNGHAAAHAPPKKGRDAQSSGWFDYFAGFRVLFPYLWPSDSPLHQATVIACVILLIIQRLVQVAVPVMLGWLVDSLGYGKIPYKEIVLYIVFRGLQGGQGLIGAARAVLWIPVSQGLFRRLSCAAFEHVLGLSMDFHLSKRIGEVTSALSRGASMNTFLENFLFQVFPMLFDIFVAGIYFFIMYDAFYTLIVFIIMWTYIFLTMYMAKWRGRQRRDMATKAREMDAAKTDAILAYETVQHNCAVPAETKRFSNQVTVYQRAERLVQLSLNLLNVTQSSVFTLGTALIVVVSAYKISLGQQKVSDFVTLITYFAQLQAPLGFFGT
ncbi:hypothetical protein SLS62_011406 [Diatrype stigma]|uniref:ABC transmembrane type-1 domain-containing protein n=1 Tax=Diatrype stigma TaxID=117547 RepID=A0AAN9YF34_9PEZI